MNPNRTEMMLDNLSDNADREDACAAELLAYVMRNLANNNVTLGMAVNIADVVTKRERAAATRETVRLIRATLAK